MSNLRVAVAVVLLVAGAGLSWLLLLQHHGEGKAADALCGEGAQAGCDLVNRSAWSEVAGVPLAAVGLFFYASLVLLLALAGLAGGEARDGAAAAALLALGAALLVDLWLLGVQAFSIKAYCRLCLATYALNVGAGVSLLPARGALRRLRPAAGLPQARRLLVGWVLGSLAVAVAVSAGERALSSREAEREGSLLGGPAAASPAPDIAPQAPSTTAQAQASPSPSPSGPTGDVQRLQQELQKAQQDLKRLQETIDDPQKLEAYFSAKATKEFEQATPQKLDLAGVPFKGPADAPIKTVEFSDFMCPYCRSLAGAFANYVPQSGNRVAVYFKNYPLDTECNKNVSNSLHPGACWLAMGGVCAQQQARFWPYHDRVFATNFANPKREDVVKVATGAGLNTAAFESCLDTPQAREKLAAEIKEGAAAGVQATPTVFINGKKVPRMNDFTQMVDKEAARLGLPPLQRPAGR